MTTAIESEVPTLADMHERLGFVPLERILMQPPPGTATEADVLAAAARPRKRLCELIDGVLVEKAMGLRKSILGVHLITMLDPVVRDANRGILLGANGAIRLWPGRVRIPDVAYYSWGRLPQRKIPREPIPLIAPDLAVEILNESNTAAEMQHKRQDYFQAGVALVWEIEPDRRLATTYTNAGSVAVLTEQDTLDSGKILPGFRLPLATLFAGLDRKGS